jgi:xylulokinase
MSLLGIDVGTTGCKAACFSEDGTLLAAAYREYDIGHPQPGWAELDALEVWEKVRVTVREVAAQVTGDPIRAVAVSSLGEAVVPVTKDRQVLGPRGWGTGTPSILNFDVRGAEYLEGLRGTLPAEALYRTNGNTLGNHYGLTKLMWIRDHQPEVYERADKFLHWSSFIATMLGAEPAVDLSLANRTLLFDLTRRTWSDRLLAWAGLDRDKLPPTLPSGTVVGEVAPEVAAALGLPPGVVITTGAHDQCANAVGCGVLDEGHAVYGMGTFICVTPVFNAPSEALPPDPRAMMAQGLNTEHHAAPGRYVSFIYNQGGSLVKWYRDTFAAEEHRQARQAGRNLYAELFGEAPEGPSGLVALPTLTTTGPPHFIPDATGIIAGLRLETTRGAILKGLVEGATFYIRACIESLPEAGIAIDDFRATGGGSQSDIWVQLSADILGRPLVRPAVTEAGALGAAMMAGVGAGVFASYAEAVDAMVRLERTFTPNLARHARYAPWFERYQELWRLALPYARELHAAGEDSGV